MRPNTLNIMGARILTQLTEAMQRKCNRKATILQPLTGDLDMHSGINNTMPLLKLHSSSRLLQVPLALLHLHHLVKLHHHPQVLAHHHHHLMVPLALAVTML